MRVRVAVQVRARGARARGVQAGARMVGVRMHMWFIVGGCAAGTAHARVSTGGVRTSMRPRAARTGGVRAGAPELRVHARAGRCVLGARRGGGARVRARASVHTRARAAVRTRVGAPSGRSRVGALSGHAWAEVRAYARGSVGPGVAHGRRCARARAGRCELAHERGARGSLARNGDVQCARRCARAACARKSKGAYIGGASERCVRAGEFLRERVNRGTSSGHHTGIFNRQAAKAVRL